MGFVGTLIITVSALLGVLARGNISSGAIAMSISYAMSITQTLNWMVRQTSQRETSIVSVERVTHYAEGAPQENPPRSNPPLADNWPSAGRIEIKNLQLKYRKDLPLVLKGIDLDIEAGEKI